MNRNQKIILAGYAVVILAPLVNYAYATIKFKLHCKRVDEETRLDLLRINRAEKIMHERIRRGEYTYRTVDAIREDFEFFRMTAEV